MNTTILNIILLTFTFSSLSYGQVYRLSSNESIIDSYILSENNFAFILEMTDKYNNKEYDIIHNQNRLRGYKEFSTLKILEDGILVASMLKKSVAKDMWAFIYDDTEFEFDSIDHIEFSGNNDRIMVFAKKLDNGFAVIDGKYEDYNYEILFDYKITSKRYAYSYMRDDLYYINIDGVEISVLGEVQKITFSDDSERLAYVVISEGTQNIIVDDDINEMYSIVNEIAFAKNNLLAYTAKVLPPLPETNESETELMKTVEVMNEDKKTTNRLPLTNDTNRLPNNYEAIIVIGPSDTVALLNTNETSPTYLYDIFTVASTNQVITNNEPILESVFFEKIKFKDYENIKDLSFSPNSKTLTFIFKESDKYYLSQSGNTNSEYNNIETYKYSPNSQNIVVATTSLDKINIILNASKIYTIDILDNIYYSDNILALSVEKENRKFIYSSDFESPAYTEIISFKFSEDGNSFALTAKRFDKYYQFSFSIENPRREESFGYNYISDVFLSNETSDFLSLSLKDNTLYLLKNGLEKPF